MSRLGLVSRILLILFIGAIAVSIIGWILYQSEKGRVIQEARLDRIADRMIQPLLTLTQAETIDRPHLARSLSSPRRLVHLSPNPLPLRIEDDLDPTPLKDRLSGDLVEMGITEFQVLVVHGESLPRPSRHMQPRSRWQDDDDDDHHPPHRREFGWRARDWEDLPSAVLIARLDPSTWITIAQPIAPLTLAGPGPARTILGLAMLAFLLVVAITVWGAFRTGRPLRQFAEAADRLGRDVNAPPLDDSKGPRETRHAARAFNNMQRRIKGYVEDRTRMLAAISHDLRTPITRMRLRAEFVEDDEQRDKMLADLQEMEAMIAATLAFIRDDAAEEAVKRLDLAALVSAVVEDTAETGAAVTYTGPDSLPSEGRPLALKRAIANLVGNAVKYGGVARVNLAAEPANLRLTVEDDGPGIPEAHLARVFDPFYRVEPSRGRDTGGTGLGLSVVRSVARAHGGEVTLTNRAEGGLRATLTLPT